MLTGEIRSQIDRIWDTFWSGGISNPLEVIEQITYLLFLKRLDEQETAEELKANQTKKPMQKRFFPEGKDGKKRRYQDYRWKNFKNFEPRDMYTVVSEHVFPWLRTLGGNGTTYSKHMEGARFTIPTPALLAKVVDMIDKVPMEDRDTKGDLYEYMLGKIATAGQNGQFRTPRHIIRLMVEMVEPKPTDVVCDPACGTCGFLVAVGESLRVRHPEVLTNAKLRQHFHHKLFHGFDFDNTMLRIGSMNMLLHGVENPDVVYRDSLSQDHAGEDEKYTLVMANPPFAGSLDYESCAKDLQQVVKTKKTKLMEEEHVKNNLPDILARWRGRDGKERKRPRTAQSFCVTKADIAAQGYDLSLNRYKEVMHDEVAHRPPKEILAELAKLEEEIQQGMKELEEMLK